MWLDTPSKEEQKIIDKYQKYTSRYNVLSIPLKYWDAFDELETIHKSYYELFQNHFDDLKYYALMYRDVELTNHIFMHDMAFFTQKKNEIIGFKKRILADYSLKSQVVQLFYNYEPMFVSFCEEVLDIKNWRRRPAGNGYDYERDYVAIKSGILRDLRFCVDKLTEEQCKIIIEHKNEIINYSSSLCVDILPSIKTKTEFVEKFFIPCFFSENSKWEIRRKHLVDYIKQKFPTEDLNCFLDLHKVKIIRALSIREINYYSCHYLYEGEDVKILKESKPKLEYYPMRMPMYTINESNETILRPRENLKDYLKPFPVESIEERMNRLRVQCERENKIKEEHEKWFQKECREIDERNIAKKVKIKEIDDQIDKIKRQKQEELINTYNSIIKNVENSLFNSGNIWSHIYENPNDFASYIDERNNVCLRKYWLNDSDSVRAYFQCHCNYDGIFETFYELNKTGNKFINSEEYKNFQIKPFERIKVDRWISSVESFLKKIEEQDKIERERKSELERLEYEKRMEKYRFNKRNSHERDKNIELRQSDHIYIVNGIALDSVTTFVNNAFPKFDAKSHAKRKAEQLGISPEEVLEMWEQKGKESRDLGTAMHSKIENYYLGYDSQETDTYKLFKMFADKIELKPYRTEWAVYDLKHNIAGTIDFVDYQNGEYIIYDWKRSEKIIENGMPVKINKYGEKGNYPLEHLDNTPYYHYALQLSLYKYILEKNYGMKISDLRLGIFHPTYKKPYVLRMPYLEKEINDIFSLRSEILF